MKLLLLLFALSSALLVHADDGCPENEKLGLIEYECDKDFTVSKEKKCVCKPSFGRNDDNECIDMKVCVKDGGTTTTTTEKPTTTPKPVTTPCPTPTKPKPASPCKEGYKLAVVRCHRTYGSNYGYCYACVPDKSYYPDKPKN